MTGLRVHSWNSRRFGPVALASTAKPLPSSVAPVCRPVARFDVDGPQHTRSLAGALLDVMLVESLWWSQPPSDTGCRAAMLVLELALLSVRRPESACKLEGISCPEFHMPLFTYFRVGIIYCTKLLSGGDQSGRR